MTVFTLTFSFVPETSKTVLATALDFEGDALCIHDGLGDTHENGACYCGTWLIEWLIQGDLHIAFVAMSLAVSEKFHLGCWFSIIQN